MAEAVAYVFTHVDWMSADRGTWSSELSVHSFKAIFFLGGLFR
jgi:hypothetical protein